MDKAREVTNLCIINFRKWHSNPRIIVLSIYLIITFYNYFTGVKLLSENMQISITPWLFPFLFNNLNSIVVIMLGLILLFCDAPFIDEQQPYLILRVGKKLWLAAQILYVILASFVYAFFIFIMTLVLCLPNVGVSSKWGDIIKMIAVGGLNEKYNINFNVPFEFLETYTPIKAFCLSFLLVWMIFIFLGLIIFIFNMHFSQIVGTLLASLFVLFHVFADFFNLMHNLSNNSIYYFSPVSWANLNCLQMHNSDVLPSPMYAVSILIVLNLFFIVIAFHSLKTKEIEVIPQI